MFRRYIYLIVVIAVLISLVVIFIVILKPDKNGKIAQETTQKTMQNYSYQGVVTYTQQGQIRADQNYREIKILVSRTHATLEVVAGYQGNIIESQSFTNNEEAFKAFLAALNQLGYNDQRKLAVNASIEGQCPLGKRYIFTSENIEISPKFSWTTSCAPKTSGNFDGNLSNIQRLFTMQIPDYSNLVSDVRL